MTKIIKKYKETDKVLITDDFYKTELDLKVDKVQNNYTAIIDPTVDDDWTEWYSVTSLWYNTISKEAFRCFDVTTWVAVWLKTTLTIDELWSMALEDADDYTPTDDLWSMAFEDTTSFEPTLTKWDLTETTSSVLTITWWTDAIIWPWITIEVDQADTSNDWFLSSTDWNTFNNKQDKFLTATAGENVTAGQLCYLKSDGKYWLAKADAEATSWGKLVIATASISADASWTFQESWDYTTTGLTAGSTYYVSEATAGAITVTAPSTTAGDVIRIVGYAKSTTILNIQIDPTYLVV